jgi:hypothetical protein
MKPYYNVYGGNGWQEIPLLASIRKINTVMALAVRLGVAVMAKMASYRGNIKLSSVLFEALAFCNK